LFYSSLLLIISLFIDTYTYINSVIFYISIYILYYIILLILISLISDFFISIIAAPFSSSVVLNVAWFVSLLDTFLYYYFYFYVNLGLSSCFILAIVFIFLTIWWSNLENSDANFAFNEASNISLNKNIIYT
jgi:hypothetical protein